MLDFVYDFACQHGGPVELFEKLDVNGDAQLEQDEFANLVEKMGFFDLDWCPDFIATPELVYPYSILHRIILS